MGGRQDELEAVALDDRSGASAEMLDICLADPVYPRREAASPSPPDETSNVKIHHLVGTMTFRHDHIASGPGRRLWIIGPLL